MTILNNLKLGLIGSSVIFSVSSFAAPRTPMHCRLESGESTKYEQFNFSAYVNEENKKINFDLNVSDSEGKTIITKANVQSYSLNQDLIVVDLGIGGAQSIVSFPKNILSKFVSGKGKWGSRNLDCSGVGTGLSDSFAPQEFERYNMPAHTENNHLDVKSWSSSDNFISLKVVLWPTIPPSGHYGGLLTHTEVELDLYGKVVDNLADQPRYLAYMLYGNSKKTVEIRLTKKEDVEGLSQIFPKKTVVTLMHPYGHNTPVDVEIDCGVSECIITAGK